MPATLTYPGVYVEEIPSGVRTITGVATSITAFLGRALQGPTDEPITINSFGDFERQFGGLHVDYPMSYAVRDFYLNGGGQAIIVRLYKANGAEGSSDTTGATGTTEDTETTGATGATTEVAGASGGTGATGETEEPTENTEGAGETKPKGAGGKAELTVGGLKLTANSPGTWADKLQASLDTVASVTDEMRKRFSLGAGDNLFNLTVQLGDTSDAPREIFLNLTMSEKSARRVDRVLRAESSWVEYEWSSSDSVVPTETEMGIASEGSNSQPLDAESYTGSEAKKTGLYALEKADLFNLLCIPPDVREGNTPETVYQKAMAYCQKRRAMLIVDSPAKWGTKKEIAAQTARDGLGDLGLSGTEARNAALYFPRVLQKDPLREGQLDTFVPCGIIAGRMAHTDATRGVWKAPAGLDASLNGIQGLQVNLTDSENGMLNPLGINCLRSFPVNGRVIWGARTLRGADQLADEYKYIPIRRLALFIEESLYRGTQWVVFEPNDEPLWAQIRMNVGAFMHTLFRQGAFQGTSPKQAYFVKCDKDTNPQNDIDRGIVNIAIGFAPLKPAEFVVLKIQQIAGDLEF